MSNSLAMLERRRMMFLKGLLPSGYTQYDYIERGDTDTTSYIPIDLYPNKSKLWTFSGSFARTADFGGNYTVYAILHRQGVGTYDSNYLIARHAKDYNKVRFNYNSRLNIETYSGLSSVTINVGVWHTFELASNDSITYGGQLTIDGTTDTFNYGANPYSNTTAPLVLLKGYKCRLAEFKVYYDGAMVADLMPAMRNSDSAVGFYDIVRGTFYTPIGGGTFTAGNGLDNFNI